MPRERPPKEQTGGIPELETVATSQAEGKDIQLLADPSRMEGYLQLSIQSPDAKITLDEVLKLVDDHKVKLTDEGRTAVAKLVDECRPGGLVLPAVIARGRKAEDGVDGSVEWLVTEPGQTVSDERTAQVDYRERNAIVNVREGTPILRLVPPTEGVPGEDIFGNATAAQPGRPAAMRKGKNVDASDDGAQLLATMTGKLVVSDGAVSVDPLLAINGDVDMTVGNIEFLGPVKVSGDILDGFRVKSEREIEVGGMVEAAELESGSFVRVNGGVAGKGKGRIACKGAFEARYLSEVTVEAGGDVVVANSIVNSTVRSLGAVTVTSGGIRGSRVVAQKGLRTPELGSELGVHTIVVVGLDYHLRDALVTAERQMGVVREALEKIMQALGPLAGKSELLLSLPPEKGEIGIRLIAQMDLLNKRLKTLAAKREALLARMQLSEDVAVTVDKKIFPGVIMQIGNCKRTFELEVTGPVKLTPDLENGSLKAAR